jgi:O-antigen ligase/tetratricopeptide (TPR) repeat protein
VTWYSGSHMKDVLKAVVYGALFTVPFLTLYVENDYFFPFITGKNFWFRILVDVAFAAWILLALYEVKYRPRISGITWSFGALLIVMFFANLFGLHPPSSFWSNFERMDGYVSLVHTFMYMLMLGSVLQTKKEWQWILNVSLFVALIVAMYGLAQSSGLVDGGRNRIDSRLGNAAYMAIYMLFHIFTAFWLFVESKTQLNKLMYGAMSLLFMYVLIETGTRGTVVGLAVGIMVMVAYIGLFGKQFVQYRKYAIGVFIFLILAIGAFVGARDSEFVQNNQNLRRIANISLQDLQIRSIIWGTAWEGVKERPLLGYGQSNFNYIFNENYDPRLYAQEQWFDRSHNIFMDWLVTGGFLGLIAYLSIFGWCVWYLLIRPLIKKDDDTFNVLERAVLLGILAGYFTHNLVVFDNIVSYIFFAIILGLITSRVGKVPEKLQKLKVEPVLISQFAAPVVGVLLVAGIYFFHVPGMQAAGDIIDAFRSQDVEVQLEAFKRALERDSFARQEITEQLAQRAISVVRSQDVPEEVRNQWASAAETELINLAEWKPGDARIHVFIGSYYRAIGQNDKSAEHMAIARALSPQKQSIIQQQGFAELSRGANEAARDFFKEAFELDERNQEAREYYLASLFYTGQGDEALALMEIEDEAERTRFWNRIAASDFVISAANQAGRTDFMIELFEYRINADSKEWAANPQTWATLAYLYYQGENNERAIEVLETAAERLPAFASTSLCFIENIENGREPQEGCQ